VPALTETEARARAAFIAVDSYDVFIDLNPEAATPVRSRTEIRFTCAEPGAATFAELTATAVSAVLNGREAGAPADGRLALSGLAAENTLVVEAEVAADALTRFTDPADGAGYLVFTGYPTESPRLFCCFDQVDQNGGHNFVGSNLGWNQEAALDLDMASAICPNCKIVLVEGNSNSFGNLAIAVNTAANLPNVIAVSNSYGGGEGGTASFESSYDHLGIAVTASTGDSGFAGGVQFPASSPHVIAVGGTSLVRDGSARGWTESVWSGAGSGCSSVYAKPTWQHDPSCSRRMVGDVSAVAAPSTGVSVYAPTGAGSAWLVFGGTSVSAPIIAGVYALNGGFVTYGSDPYGDTADLFDVTTGSNGSCGGTYFCTGKVGYDGPTGLGTPNGFGAL